MTAVSEATLTLTITLEEAQVLAQALDLLASDPSRTAVRPLTSAESPVDLMSTGDEWPNVEDNDTPELTALGYAAFDLSSRVHDLINTTATLGGRGINGAATPSWVEGLRATMGR